MDRLCYLVAMHIIWANRKRLFLICFYLGLLLLGVWLRDLVMVYSNPELWPIDPSTIYSLIALIVTLYIVTSAIPFIPGAEIGFGMLLVFGAKVALLVYASMVVALHLAYFAGRFVPTRQLTCVFGYLKFRRFCQLIADVETMDEAQRLDYLLQHAPNRIVPLMLRYRYLTLILLLNTPGNFLLGGGGGIGFVVGMSRLYSFRAYLVSVLLAVAPIPLIFWLLERFTS